MYKNSDEYGEIIRMVRDMKNLKGSFVFGSDWRIPIHYGRQKMNTINKAREQNRVRFQTNYLCDWVGVSTGGVVNISKLIKNRVLEPKDIEFECPRDKRGNFMLNEYIISIDVARSESQNNNKTCIIVFKLERGSNGAIRQIRVVNIMTPPNGLNFSEQSAIIKRLFYTYGGNLNMDKSRVKAIVVDANGVGAGVVDRLLEEQTDSLTHEELGCFATINTDQKPQNIEAPKVVYALKAQGCNSEMISTFIGYVEASKILFISKLDNDDGTADISDLSRDESVLLEQQSLQVERLIDEISNLKLKINDINKKLTVERVLSKIDKDRYSALIMGLYYIKVFLDIAEEDDEEDERDFVFW